MFRCVQINYTGFPKWIGIWNEFEFTANAIYVYKYRNKEHSWRRKKQTFQSKTVFRNDCIRREFLFVTTFSWFRVNFAWFSGAFLFYPQEIVCRRIRVHALDSYSIPSFAINWLAFEIRMVFFRLLFVAKMKMIISLFTKIAIGSLFMSSDS